MPWRKTKVVILSGYAGYMVWTVVMCVVWIKRFFLNSHWAGMVTVPEQENRQGLAPFKHKDQAPCFAHALHNAVERKHILKGQLCNDIDRL